MASSESSHPVRIPIGRTRADLCLSRRNRVREHWWQHWSQQRCTTGGHVYTKGHFPPTIYLKSSTEDYSLGCFLKDMFPFVALTCVGDVEMVQCQCVVMRCRDAQSERRVPGADHLSSREQAISAGLQVSTFFPCCATKMDLSNAVSEYVKLGIKLTVCRCRDPLQWCRWRVEWQTGACTRHPAVILSIQRLRI